MSRIMGFIHDQLVASGHSVDYFCSDDIPPSLGGRLSRFAFPLLVRNRAVTAYRKGIGYDLINVHEPNSSMIATFKRAAGKSSGSSNQSRSREAWMGNDSGGEAFGR
jgi:hypothetical protein